VNESSLKLRQNNFFYLLFALLFLLVSLPLITDAFGMKFPIIGRLSFSVILIFLILGLNQDKKWRTIGLLLVIAGITLNTLAFHKDSNFYLYLSTLCDFLFILLIIFTALNQIIYSDKISLHNLAGTVCVYLLAGILWSLVYYFLNTSMPGSFEGNLSSTKQLHLHDFVYFSFVTLTTLGYGDIVPITATARSVVYIEAIFAQFYIAILVAGLVSVHISNKIKED